MCPFINMIMIKVLYYELIKIFYLSKERLGVPPISPTWIITSHSKQTNNQQTRYMPREEIHTYKVLLLYTTYRRSEIHKVRNHIMKAKFNFRLYHFSVLELYCPWYGGNANYDFRLITAVPLKQYIHVISKHGQEL